VRSPTRTAATRAAAQWLRASTGRRHRGALRRQLHPPTSRIFVEPIQERAAISCRPSVRPLAARALRPARFMLVADEVQSGVGRTGKTGPVEWTESSRTSWSPQGLRVGDADWSVDRERFGDDLGNPGPTLHFGGNPVSCAAPSPRSTWWTACAAHYPIGDRMDGGRPAASGASPARSATPRAGLMIGVELVKDRETPGALPELAIVWTDRRVQEGLLLLAPARASSARAAAGPGRVRRGHGTRNLDECLGLED